VSAAALIAAPLIWILALVALQRLGELVLSHVQEDRSSAAYSGDATVQQGWTAKAP